MKRKISALALVLLLALSVSASAIEPRGIDNRATLSFGKSIAYCDVTISKPGSINATITLWKGSTSIETWEESGTDSISFSGTASVTAGGLYELTVDYTVNGKSQPQLSASAVC